MEFVWRNYVLVINGNYWVKTTNSIELLSQLLMVFIVDFLRLSLLGIITV